MHFEWDALKNLSNRAKHDIDFDTAQRVFGDPRHLTVPERARLDQREQAAQTRLRDHDAEHGCQR